MTTPWAIVVGAAIVGLSIVASQALAPYRLVPFTAMMWRVNIITGDARHCMLEAGGTLKCSGG